MLKYIKEAILAPISEYWTVILGALLLGGGACIFILAANIAPLTLEDFLVLFLVPVGVVFGYFLYRSILENVTENMFGNTIGALVAIVGGIFSVVYIQGKQWSNDESLSESPIILYLILSSLLWIAGLHLILQTYPLGSGKTIKHLMRELRFSERQKLDWLQEGKTDYTVEVFKLDRIPYDITSINKDAESPQKIDSVLTNFYSHRRKTDKQRVMILVGSFGTGKSTALVNSVIRQLNDVCHGYAIPVYVKLSDCFNRDDLTGKYLSYDDFFNRICEQYHLTDSYKETLYTFHQNRKITYIFDGLNEILQMNVGDNSMEIEAQHLINYLYTFLAGNDCVISFYPMPGIITSQSLSIDNPIRKYQMYGIYGIAEAEAIKRKSTEAPVNDNILDSVALFRMFEMAEKDDSRKTTYDLLESTLEARLDSLIAGSVKEMGKLENLVEDTLFNSENVDFSAPYSPIPLQENINYSELCDMRILSECTIEDQDQIITGCRFRHILIYEFFVARVILKKLENDLLSAQDRKSIHDILRGPYIEEPEIKRHDINYLKHIHVEETNRLIFEKLNKDSDSDKIGKLLGCLLTNLTSDSFKSEDDLNYLVFLLKVGINSEDLKNYIVNDSRKTILDYIKEENVNSLKNEKLKIALVGLCGSGFNIEKEMTNWNSSFVALKRDYYKKIQET